MEVKDLKTKRDSILAQLVAHGSADVSSAASSREVPDARAPVSPASKKGAAESESDDSNHELFGLPAQSPRAAGDEGGLAISEASSDNEDCDYGEDPE